MMRNHPKHGNRKRERKSVKRMAKRCQIEMESAFKSISHQRQPIVEHRIRHEVRRRLSKQSMQIFDAIVGSELMNIAKEKAAYGQT